MKRPRTIALLVLLLALVGTTAVLCGIQDTMHKARVDEQTFAGDAAAATGVEVQFGSEVWAKLGWRHQYTFGSPQTQTTKFQREKYTGEEQESAAAELSMLADSTAIDHPIFPELRQLTERQAARELTESDGKTLALIEEFFTADGMQTLLSLDDRLPKASDANKVTPEPSIDLKMNEVLRYYPLSGTVVDAKGKAASFDLMSGIFPQSKQADGSLWEDINRFFRIPMLPNESMRCEVTRFSAEDDDLYVEPKGWNAMVGVPGEDHFAFAMTFCAADDAIYFTFDPHTENGELVDLSLIPGGYGIYKLPYDRERDVFLSGELEMVYALDPALHYVDMHLSPDGQKLLLEREERSVMAADSEAFAQLVPEPDDEEEYYEVKLTAETIDFTRMEAEGSQEVLRGLDSVSCRDGGDYLVFSDGTSRMCVLSYADGRYERTLSLENLRLDNGLTETLPTYSLMRESYYDGERLVLVGLSYVELTDTSAYGAYADYSGGVDVAVYDANGLAYYGKLTSNLQEWQDDGDFLHWKERIEPIGKSVKNYRNTGRFGRISVREGRLQVGVARQTAV